MPTSPCEWIRTFVRTVAWLALAGCAIIFVALSAPYLLSEPLPRTNEFEEAQVRFMHRVLAGTEDVWDDVFRAAGRRYEKPTLVLFTKVTRSACGLAQAVTGPFYCPEDRKIYLDLSFFDQLKREYHAPGDFAQAYVIAHEVGHHVQTILGIEYKVRVMQKADEQRANQLNVAVELQADCLAGVWASFERKRPGVLLTPEDIEEALRATRALGDDMIQGLEPGTVVLDAFSHGTGEQRSNWFKRGLDSGKIAACNTFSQLPARGP